MRDPYVILGVSREDDADLIKAAYLALLKRYHPDKAGNDPEGIEKFLQIRAAWESISNPSHNKRVWDVLHEPNATGRKSASRPQRPSTRPTFVSPKDQRATSYTESGSSRNVPYSILNYLRYAAETLLICVFASIVGLLALVLLG